jgi:cysteinyl-tRNA synthetase
MRDLVQNISAYAKDLDNDFIIIPQNGQELMTEDGEPDGPLSSGYINAIDGIGREDLFYGYVRDDEPTPARETDMMIAFLDLARDIGLSVLVTDYCSAKDRVDRSYEKNDGSGFISYAADDRDLDDIPAYPAVPNDVNSDDITDLSMARNFLYILDPTAFGSRAIYLDDLRDTDHDLLIIDAFYDDEQLTPQEVGSLRIKANGGKRLVIAYMSIGEAEDYRYYWKDEWGKDPPSWLGGENPDWKGNYKVRYWDPEWQNLIFGNDHSYLDRIMDAGFDGVYLDLIDAYEYYE